jgi:hypothetical protein
MRKSLARLVGESATLDTIELKVNPPYTWNCHHPPQGNLPKYDGQWKPVEE